jgi:IS5 family transposase
MHASAAVHRLARLARKGKGKEAKLSYLANALMENRNGLLVAVDVRHASGTGERDGALDLLIAAGAKRGATLGADKGYDTQDFLAALKELGIKPHIARSIKGRRSAIDGRAARGKGYAMSLQIRKRIEQGFGWIKTIGGLRKLPLVALSNVRGWRSIFLPASRSPLCGPNCATRSRARATSSTAIRRHPNRKIGRSVTHPFMFHYISN